MIRDVCTGFFRFGTLPVRAQTIILERDFTIQQQRGASVYRAQGTWEKDGKPTGEFSVTTGSKVTRFDLRSTSPLTAELKEIRDRLLERVRELARPGGFHVETEANGETLVAEGEIVNHHQWKPSRLVAERFDRHTGLCRDLSGSRAFCPALSATCLHTKGLNMSG